MCLFCSEVSSLTNGRRTAPTINQCGRRMHIKRILRLPTESSLASACGQEEGRARRANREFMSIR